MIATGRVSWFNLDKKFGFLELEDGSADAFLHMAVLKRAGYVCVPRGTTMRVEIAEEPSGRRHRVVEVLAVDTTSARAGELPPVLRKTVT